MPKWRVPWGYGFAYSFLFFLPLLSNTLSVTLESSGDPICCSEWYGVWKEMVGVGVQVL